MNHQLEDTLIAFWIGFDLVRFYRHEQELTDLDQLSEIHNTYIQASY